MQQINRLQSAELTPKGRGTHSLLPVLFKRKNNANTIILCL